MRMRGRLGLECKFAPYICEIAATSYPPPSLTRLAFQRRSNPYAAHANAHGIRISASFMLRVEQLTGQRLCQASHITPVSKHIASSIQLARQHSTGGEPQIVQDHCYTSHAPTIFTSSATPKPRASSSESTMEVSYRGANGHFVHLWHTGSSPSTAVLVNPSRIFLPRATRSLLCSLRYLC